MNPSLYAKSSSCNLGSSPMSGSIEMLGAISGSGDHLGVEFP